MSLFQDFQFLGVVTNDHLFVYCISHLSSFFVP